jgi:hypothetical protein
LTDEVTVGIPRTARASRSASIWKFVAPINLALLAFVLFFAGLRLARPRTVFYYTEGPVLGSLAALEASGDVTSLYPADGWTDPPTVLTLYPPVYFVLAAAIDQGAGTAGTLFGLRLLSAAALAGVVGLLTWQGIRRRVPASWLLAIGASALLTPGVYSVVAGAQPDSLALLWSWAGIWAALRLVESPSDGAGRVPWLVAGVTFLLAFFTKQSFIAAPVAFTIALFLARRRRAALTFAAVFAVAALGGVALLDQVSAGGFLANTVGALTGSTGLANLRSTLAESGPAQWTLLALVVGVAVTGRLRPGFPELYLLGSAALHTTAMLKTGSSVNYLLEPTFALLLLAIVRSPAREPGAGAAKPATSPFLAPGLAIGLALALLVVTGRAAWREATTARGWMASDTGARVSEFRGHPLTDAFFFPAVLEHGERPWLNDPFAFGVLEETGRWDPAPLVADLDARRVPFALTLVHPGPAPVPAGVGSKELVMAYFWRSRPVWGALNRAYRLVGKGPVYVWLPAEADR